MTAVQLYSFDNLWEGSTVEEKLHFKVNWFGLVELANFAANFTFRTDGGPVFMKKSSSGFQRWTYKKDVGEVANWGSYIRVQEETQ